MPWRATVAFWIQRATVAVGFSTKPQVRYVENEEEEPQAWLLKML